MKRLKPGTFALIVVLALLTFLVVKVKRTHLTAEEATVAAARPLVKLGDTVARHEYAATGVLALVALFAFVMWTALRAKEEEGKATPPARESGASGTTPSR